MITNFSPAGQENRPDHTFKRSHTGRPPSLVLDILREAAQEVPDVLSSPGPVAYILNYDDFGISYLVKYWVTDFAHKYTSAEMSPGSSGISSSGIILRFPLPWLRRLRKWFKQSEAKEAAIAEQRKKKGLIPTAQLRSAALPGRGEGRGASCFAGRGPAARRFGEPSEICPRRSPFPAG